ncbi:PorP/SprF family type IX secretion system membrane protein [Chryseosolibacter indicus]|uniref:PorP/SprF family type IX secretion system membrane protein n=1 Tax=Chryseosolibacter indicus TaxID=2782351 RepID=A0ABS5VTT2_9BACT|nr:PorP/SprF family type IX secretion system membrane protein [Chryseosolibacter indicus]MBT1704468.1 PorP/SprF family type IX secretion system membrane protein [Chryseosolibacter indicus]
MKSFLLAALLFVNVHLFGQYLPNNSQVFQFSSVLNPAFSGIENFNDLKLSYRYQWTGFGSQAPKFVNLAYNTRLKQPLELGYNSLRLSNPAMVRIPRKRRMIQGFSLNVFQSSVGVIKSLGAGASFSVNYPIVRQWRVSAGAGAFIENRKLDIASVDVGDDNDPFYNHLLNSSTSQTDLNLRAGVLFYTPEFYFGFSYLPIVYKPIQASELAMEEAFYKATIQLGYAFNVNPDLSIKPSILGLLQIDNSMSYDFNVKAYIQNKVWAGLSYRSTKNGIGMVGFNLNEKLSASYSYELSLSDFQQFGGGSHELVLGVRFNNVRKYNQYTW